MEHCKNVHDLNMYSQALRHFIARGSNIGSCRASPTKVEACQSFLFTEKSQCIENKEHLVHFDIALSVNTIRSIKHNLLVITLYIRKNIFVSIKKIVRQLILIVLEQKLHSFNRVIFKFVLKRFCVIN